MPYSAQDYEVQRGLQAVTLENPPLIKRWAELLFSPINIQPTELCPLLGRSLPSPSSCLCHSPAPLSGRSLPCPPSCQCHSLLRPTSSPLNCLFHSPLGPISSPLSCLCHRLPWTDLLPPSLCLSPLRLARPVSALSGVSRQEHVRQQPHAPYKGSLLDLLKLCKESDR
jgi:hypothetical protein